MALKTAARISGDNTVDSTITKIRASEDVSDLCPVDNIYSGDNVVLRIENGKCSGNMGAEYCKNCPFLKR